MEQGLVRSSAYVPGARLCRELKVSGLMPSLRAANRPAPTLA